MYYQKRIKLGKLKTEALWPPLYIYIIFSTWTYIDQVQVAPPHRRRLEEVVLVGSVALWVVVWVGCR